MPIKLYTGLPGNGKTSFMVAELLDEAKKAKRPLVACGIDGLDEGIALPLDDPRQWNAKDEAGQHIVPDGSLIFVDEAWKWFGHLHDASRQATPPHVLALAEHRHRGIDFVMTTQVPAQLYPFARGMIATHTHCVRRFGTKWVDLYTWEELNEDVKSPTKRDNAQRKTVTLPEHAWKRFKSASVHTIKRSIPLKVYLIPIVLVAGIACAVFAVRQLAPSALSTKLAVPGSDTKSDAPGTARSTGEGSGGSSAEPMTAAEYAKRHLPRFATMPWTAPVYDDRAVTAEPGLFCIVSKAGIDGQGNHSEGRCQCYTEQATPYDLSDGECRRVARRGAPYNPYKRRMPEGAGQGPASAAGASMASTAGAGGAALVGAGSTRTPYGAPPRASGTFALDPRPANSGGGL